MAFSRASRHDMEGTFERSRRQLWELSAHVTQLAPKGIPHPIFLITNGPAEPKSTVGLEIEIKGSLIWDTPGKANSHLGVSSWAVLRQNSSLIREGV